MSEDDDDEETNNDGEEEDMNVTVSHVSVHPVEINKLKGALDKIKTHSHDFEMQVSD